MLIVASGDNQHEKSKPIFWEKIYIYMYFKMLYAEIYAQAAKQIIELWNFTNIDSTGEYGNVLKFRTPKCLTKWHMQTVQTEIRLLLKEQSDHQGLQCLSFH